MFPPHFLWHAVVVLAFSVFCPLFGCTCPLQAAPAAIATMAATFPNAMQEDNFIRAVAAELFNLGFRP